jgi:hypothetical protein
MLLGQSTSKLLFFNRLKEPFALQLFLLIRIAFAASDKLEWLMLQLHFDGKVTLISDKLNSEHRSISSWTGPLSNSTKRAIDLILTSLILLRLSAA